ETFLMVSASDFRILAPVGVSPVKATLSMSGCDARASPIRAPGPGRTLMRPSGTPASAQISPIRRAESGVALAGLRMMVQPAARAGATFQEAIENGKFQGTIWAQTPTGSRRVMSTIPSPIGVVSPENLSP